MQGKGSAGLLVIDEYEGVFSEDSRRVEHFVVWRRRERWVAYVSEKGGVRVDVDGGMILRRDADH
jgi:hypothetical protein